MIQTRSISVQEAKLVGDAIGIDWNVVDINQFRRGLEVELEHGLVTSGTNVTNDDMLTTGKIALAHINEISDYYTKLDLLENAKLNANTTTPPRVSNSSLNMFLGAALGIGAVVLYKKYTEK